MPKSLHHFEEEIAGTLQLRQYVKLLEESYSFTVLCRECSLTIHTHVEKDHIKFASLPDDDWLDTAPSMDYYCAQSCGSSHMPLSLENKSPNKYKACHRHSEGLLGFSNLAEATSKWLPNAKKIVLTNSFVMLQENVSE